MPKRIESTPSENIKFIKAVPIFKNLDEYSFKLLANKASCIQFLKGELVYKKNGFINYFYIIIEGKITEFVTNQTNIDNAIITRVKNDYLGEIGIILDSTYVTTAIAKTNTILLSISKETFLSVLWEHPSIFKHIIKILLKRLESSADKVISYTQFNTKARLAYTLIVLNEESGDNAPIKETHSFIANYCGLARQTTSKILSKWNKEKIISTSYRSITLLDKKKLHDIIYDYEL